MQLAGFCVLVTGTIVYGKGDEKEIEEEMAVYDSAVGVEDGRGGAAVEGWQRQSTIFGCFVILK